MIITIDGPTASGKSTVGALLAQRLGYYYINSGLLFRALAYLLAARHHAVHSQDYDRDSLNELIQGCIYDYHPTDGARISYDSVDITPFLKEKTIDTISSKLSTHPLFRDIVLQWQRRLAHTHNSIVDGRDTGTAVFPDAEYKFFLTAELPVRAARWANDQLKRGNRYSQHEAEQLVNERDKRDKERVHSPLRMPDDAIMINSSTLSIDQVIDMMVDVVEKK